MSFLRQAPLLSRRALAAAAALILLAAIVVVFSGSLSHSTDVEAQAEQARASLAETEARLAAGESELDFVRTEQFIEWQARIQGMGEPDERPFQLDGAPPPAPITPIGPQDGVPAPVPPFEAWMELLFGA